MTDDKKDAAGEGMKRRLRADLRIALREARIAEVKVLRALITAIDDAEAPPLKGSGGLTDGAAERSFRPLGEGDVRRVLLSDIAERERAAVEFESVGRADLAEALRLDARLVRRYLEP